MAGAQGLCSSDRCHGNGTIKGYFRFKCSHIFCSDCKRNMKRDKKIISSKHVDVILCPNCNTWSREGHEGDIQQLHDGAVRSILPQNRDMNTAGNTPMIKGIPNIGMSCCINAVLQIFAQTPKLYQALIHQDRGPISASLANVMKYVNSKSAKLNKSSIIESLKSLRAAVARRDSTFAEYVPNDSHSFFLCILQALQGEDSYDATNLFEGELMHDLKFSGCNHNADKTRQAYMSLLIPLTWTNSSNPQVSHGINILLEEETFDSKTIPCTTCQEKGRQISGITRRQLQLSKAPTILVLHIARFEQVGERLLKIKDHIRFDDKLCLPVACGFKDYSLYGVIAHYGSLEEGHYITYVKPLENRSNMWYFCSDERVDICDQSVVMNDGNAYLLFYKLV